MNVIVVSPYRNAGFIQQLLLQFESFIILKPVGMVTVVPETGLMGNDEVGAKLMCLSYDINTGINGCHDAGTFLIGFTIQYLVSGSVVIDLTISSAVLLYDFAPRGGAGRCSQVEKRGTPEEQEYPAD